jgi:predicted transcriptional regulator of viral defense system
MFGIIIAAYRDFDNRIQIQITKGLSKPDRVKELIRNTTGKLTKTEIMELCPDISQKTVERALSSLQKSGDIIKIGGGRYTTYIWNWEKTF